MAAAYVRHGLKVTRFFTPWHVFPCCSCCYYCCCCCISQAGGELGIGSPSLGLSSASCLPFISSEEQEKKKHIAHLVKLAASSKSPHVERMRAFLLQTLSGHLIVMTV
ncbi:unnamed protein product [Polarella glacialis]|uniref:Uncharacterized protein n=1 Tax=Polarella glacialis TaxID=89957 RepID=A0A813EFS5_POLGL|nr:unnamed protein product [Polarella glacialis]